MSIGSSCQSGEPSGFALMCFLVWLYSSASQTHTSWSADVVESWYLHWSHRERLVWYLLQPIGLKYCLSWFEIFFSFPPINCLAAFLPLAHTYRLSQSVALAHTINVSGMCDVDSMRPRLALCHSAANPPGLGFAFTVLCARACILNSAVRISHRLVMLSQEEECSVSWVIINVCWLVRFIVRPVRFLVN